MVSAGEGGGGVLSTAAGGVWNRRGGVSLRGSPAVDLAVREGGGRCSFVRLAGLVTQNSLFPPPVSSLFFVGSTQACAIGCRTPARPFVLPKPAGSTHVPKYSRTHVPCPFCASAASKPLSYAPFLDAFACRQQRFFGDDLQKIYHTLRETTTRQESLSIL